MKVEIIILNYNGIELLKECLPSIINAAKKSKYDCRITLLDNRSTDASVNFIEKSFPDVNVHLAKENKVFCSFMEVADKTTADVLILLNNDIKTDESFVDPLIEVFFKNSDAFLVGPKCLAFDAKGYEGTKSKWWFDKGLFSSSSRYPFYEKDIDTEGYTMQAGFGAFDKNKFLELGGFDDLYLPGIMEDADFCYRAWKRGYKGYYQPKSLIYHMGQASFKKEFGSKKIMELAHRNTFLFMWKNIEDIRLWILHFVWLPVRLFYSVITGKLEFITGFFKALPKLNKAIRKRRQINTGSLTDRDLFKISETI